MLTDYSTGQVAPRRRIEKKTTSQSSAKAPSYTMGAVRQISGGGTCRGMDAGGGAELHNMQSLICNASEYMEELQRCIGDALEKHGV